MDQNGVTAMLNSLVKPDPSLHAGGVQNMEFSKSMFTGHRPQLEALLATFFQQGGQQAMINVLDRGDLESAMKSPEKYSNLIVRVGGYCARFVDLPRDVQEEVLSRTLY
ncbi:MAG: glycine radical domain-containing protein [Bacteroidota bacterium]